MAKTEIQELSEFIRDHMMTKSDLANLATKGDVRAIIRAEVPVIVRVETKDIPSELASIRRDLGSLSENVENMIGYRKEIDYALERIAATEQHHGITKKIVA